jgi:hypothetical protein
MSRSAVDDILPVPEPIDETSFEKKSHLPEPSEESSVNAGVNNFGYTWKTSTYEPPKFGYKNF